MWLAIPMLLACTGTAPNPERPPDVLLLTVDTLRPDILSAYGYDRPSSPRIDALLEQGVTFDRAITPIARTTPALASLLTGLNPQNHGVRRLLDRLPPRLPTLPEVARDHGYQTVAVVSNHILKRKRGLDAGFDVYDFGDDGRIASRTSADALAHLGEVDAERPLLLWVHYIDPHMPYAPPESWAKAFDPDWTGAYAERFGGEPGSVGSSAYPPELGGKEKAVYANPLAEDVNAHVRRLYAADVRGTDDAIGTLLDGLVAARGDRWRVVFASDHGESLGEHHYAWDHGDYVWQGGLRIPLAFVDLASPTPRRVSEPASLIDIAPTVADWMGWTWPAPVDGLAVLHGAPADRVLFAESGKSFYPDAVRGRVDFTVGGRFRAALAGDLKVIHTPGADSAWALFDVTQDPSEANDLWDARSAGAEVTALAAALRQQLAADPKAPAAATPDAADLEALRQLGYVDD